MPRNFLQKRICDSLKIWRKVFGKQKIAEVFGKQEIAAKSFCRNDLRVGVGVGVEFGVGVRFKFSGIYLVFSVV
jgi:hypothetical protein